MDEQKPKQGHVSSGAAAQAVARPSKVPDPAVSGPLAQFEAWLYNVLVVHAPFQLPSTAKDWIVRYGPWITLAVGILLALMIFPGLMAALAISGTASLYGGLAGVAFVGAIVGPMFYVALLVLAVQLVIMFVSIPMLLKRQRRGWLLVFYSGILSAVYTLFNSFSYGFFDFGGLLFGLIGAVIGMYFLFQIRGYYKTTEQL